MKHQLLKQTWTVVTWQLDNEQSSLTVVAAKVWGGTKLLKKLSEKPPNASERDVWPTLR